MEKRKFKKVKESYMTLFVWMLFYPCNKKINLFFNSPFQLCITTLYLLIKEEASMMAIQLIKTVIVDIVHFDMFPTKFKLALE